MVPPCSPIHTSPDGPATPVLPGGNAIRIGLLRPCASWDCAKPGGRPGAIVVVTDPDALNGAPASVPVTVAVSGAAVPAGAVICAMIVTVHTAAAASAPAVQVTRLD